MASSFLAPALYRPMNDDLARLAQQPHDANSAEHEYERTVLSLPSPWERAIKKFNASVSNDNGKKLALESCPSSSLSSLLQQISIAKNEAERNRSQALNRIDSIVERVTVYSGAMDIFSQTHPALTFAWGSMKFLMQVVVSEKRVSEKLAQAIADVVQIFGRCEQYAKLFPRHDRLLEAIGVLYADVLNLLVRATRFYEKNGIKRFMSTSVTPFEIKFAPIAADIEQHSSVVESEASLAHRSEQRRILEKIELKQSNQMSKEVILWLQPSDNVNNWCKLRQVQTAETCAWLTSKDVYKTWTDMAGSSILWIYGNPGSGKSVLASYIVEQLQSHHGTPVLPLLYYFCSGRDESRRASTHILRSLIFQLQKKQSGLAHLVEEAYKASVTKTADRFEDLWALFVSMIQEQAAICVIDGLDECQDRDEDGNLERSTFAHRLVKLIHDRSSGQCLKILLTSRNEPDLRVCFLASAPFIHTISISSSDVANDIQRYISDIVESSEELPESLKTNIIQKLEMNACGMFIWARLMLEDLKKCDSEKSVEDALNSLPRDLFELYNRILHSLAYNFQRNEGSRDLGCFILCWTIYSSRPLTLTELSEARCIVPGQPSLLLSKRPFSLRDFRRQIERACSPLIEVQDDDLVQLVHHTTKEYLSHNSERLYEICLPLKTFGILSQNNSDLHSILSQACLSYLSQEVFENPLLHIKKRFYVKNAFDIRTSHPFLEYASNSWAYHVSQSAYPPYAAIRAFVQAPQALTWIEAMIILQGGVDKLAKSIQYLLMLTEPSKVTVAANEDFEVIRVWVEALQRVVLDWGGTLNQTASEIHHLDVLPMTARCSITKMTRLQKITRLEDPTRLLPHMRAVQEGASFIIGQKYAYVFPNIISMRHFFLKRYDWVSMQPFGELTFPVVQGIMSWVADTQLSASEQYVAAAKVSATKIIVAAWSVSEEGFESLPWGRKDGFIGELVAEWESFDYSHRPVYGGGGFARSARYLAFALDEKLLWTPCGAFNLETGEKSPLPQCFYDAGLVCATWSAYGQRLACLRGKSLEVYENDGRLTSVFHCSHVENALIVDFSKSARYVLVLEPDKWRYSVFDLVQQSFSFLPTFTFSKNENLLPLEMPRYYPNYTILSHAFSPDERYISFLIDDLNHKDSAVIAVWDRRLEEYLLAQIWSFYADHRASHVQFDPFRSETLHILLYPPSHSFTSGTPGFVHIDLVDKSTSNYLRESSKSNSFSRFDICLDEHNGRVYQRLYYSSFSGASDGEDFVDLICWDLEKCPPEKEARITVPKTREGWRVGYAQSNGVYGDWHMFSKKSSIAIVGGSIYSLSDKSQIPTLVYQFHPKSVWHHLLGARDEMDEKKIEKEINNFHEMCFWSFLSPNESLLCFYASKEYIIVFDVESRELRWCHRMYGESTDDYWAGKPVFHPKKPIMAWVEQFGRDNKDNFSSLKHCGVYISDVSNLESLPLRLEGVEVDHRSDLIFSPCGSFLYAGVIGRDNFSGDQRKLSLSKIDLLSKTRVAHILTFSPIKGPSYCGSPNPEYVKMILKDGEIYFLVSSDYKVMLAKIDFDGTVKWKIIASLPGPPKSPNAIALSGWNSSGKEGRLDIVLAEQQFPHPIVINTWDEVPDQWDEIQKVEHDDTL